MLGCCKSYISQMMKVLQCCFTVFKNEVLLCWVCVFLRVSLLMPLSCSYEIVHTLKFFSHTHTLFLSLSFTLSLPFARARRPFTSKAATRIARLFFCLTPCLNLLRHILLPVTHAMEWPADVS